MLLKSLVLEPHKVHYQVNYELVFKYNALKSVLNVNKQTSQTKIKNNIINIIDTV